ncbi:MAG: response regulator [Kiritimatiellae bacterium]|nr:response regulator [Kiritimatiellia bacterium]
MKRIKAWVFDDEEIVRTVMGAILKARGYEVETFSDPVLCPHVSERDGHCSSEYPCVDILITDMQMPNLMGLELVHRLDVVGCRIPHVALMSGSLSREERQRARETGCKVFDKPLDIEAFTEWLDDCERSLGYSPARTAPAEAHTRQA